MSGTDEIERWSGRPLAEMRWQAEFLRLLVDPVYLGGGRPRGDGRPVVLIPGFGGGDWSIAHMAFWLRRTGYRPVMCNFVVNAGCADRALARVERRVESVFERTGRRVALVGHSAGGYLARAAGARRPDRVSHVVALGAGLSRRLDVATLGLAGMGAAQWVQRHTTDRREQRGCMTEACSCGFSTGYATPFPDDVRLTSVYSREDGMVRWRSCVVDYADNREVSGSHVGLVWNRKAYGAIAAALAEPELSAPARPPMPAPRRKAA